VPYLRNSTPFTWQRTGGYDITTKGDKRFSAFYAIMPDGRSIEIVYHCDVKGYDPGGTNWQLGKGKPPLNLETDCLKEYIQLWRIWAHSNIPLMRELYIAAQPSCVLSDMFGWTPVNQAHALSVIMNELIANKGVK
jgi:hypothetical protein